METQPQELYSLAVLGTYAGSSGAVLLIYNTFRRLLKRENLWIAFAVSVLVSLGVAASSGALTGMQEYFLVFLNSCLLFSSAAGAQELIATPRRTKKKKSPHAFSSSWMSE